MIFLDMRTIIFSYVLTDIVCMVVIVLLWQQSRKRFEGAGFFVFNIALQTTALFLIILRGSIPDWMSFVLANTMVIAGGLLGYMGLERFVGKKSSQIYNYFLLAIFAFIHTYYTFVQSDQAIRNLNSTVGLLIICFQCAWLLLYRVKAGMRQLTRGVGIVFGAYCLVSLIRIIEYFTSVHLTSDYLRSGTFEQLILVSNQILFILLTYSLVLMFNKRLLLDIMTEEEKFSKAFHLSPYAITITRLSDGQIIEVNDGFMSITGYQLADLSEKNTYALHLWDRNEDRVLVAEELASKGGVRNREFQFRVKSGERITGLFSAEIIIINNDKCVLSSINDITERKRAEEEIKGKAIELERFNNLMIGRELMMVDLKKEINELRKRLGEEEKYRIVGKGNSKDL
jgi:PAS domain S-box-containing protein